MSFNGNQRHRSGICGCRVALVRLLSNTLKLSLKSKLSSRRYRLVPMHQDDVQLLFFFLSSLISLLSFFPPFGIYLMANVHIKRCQPTLPPQQVGKGPPDIKKLSVSHTCIYPKPKQTPGRSPTGLETPSQDCVLTSFLFFLPVAYLLAFLLPTLLSPP